MIGQNINAYFDAAMMYPVERLEAVIRGQDKSIPAAAAMMALPLKQREMAAANGMQAMQQPQQPSIRQQMAQATMPQMAPQSPQGMRQIPQQSPQQVSQLPENTGVMNLPAPNMEKMAGGGIVAFADGGDTDGIAHFDSGDLVKQEEQDREDFLYGLRRTGAAAKDIFSMPVRGVAGAAESVITRPLRAAGVPIPYLPDAFYGGDRASPTPYMDAIRREEAAKSPVAPATTPATTPATQTPSVDARTSAAKAPPVADKKKAPGIGGIPKPSTGTSMSYEDTLKKVGASDKELLGEYAKAGKEETAGMEALLKEKQDAKPKGKVGESLEKYLKGKESADVGKRAENINNAFVNAGLEMAAGDSPSILANIVKGAKAGNASYRAGIEKLDAAADERAKMFASINDARLAEEKGDWKELYAAKAEIKKSESAYRKYGIDALVKLTGENRKVAADMFNTATTNERALQVAQMNNATELKKAGIMATAYGAKTNPADKAIDNAAKALQTWKDSNEGKLEQARDKTAYARRERELMTQHFKMMGLPDPYGQNALSGNVFSDPKEQAAYNKFVGG
jgi:hypothetical protein